MSENCFFHVDLDAFFASVEQLDHPEYRGKSVIVGGLPGDRRSVVSTCSYEARKFGVHSAMPIAEAKRLCPDAIFLRGNYPHYHEKSAQVMDCFSEFSPTVMQMSIDEAFLDMSGTEKLFGNPTITARKLKNEIKIKTGLTVSVGIASNMYLAKIASGLQKPDGLFVIPRGSEEQFMLSLPLDKVWGIGKKTLEKINRKGFFTTKEISEASNSLLTELFGESTGNFLYKVVRGQYSGDFNSKPQNRSLSEERTFEFDITDLDTIDMFLLELSSDCMFRMIRHNYNSHTICLKIRYEDFTTVSIQETFPTSIKSIEMLHDYSKKLFRKKYDGRPVRLLGVGFQNLQDGIDDSQGELFDFGDKKRQKLEQVITQIKQKNPEIPIKKATLL